MNRKHPNLFAEMRRIERLAFRLTQPVDPEEAWGALSTFLSEKGDAPGWLDRVFAPRPVQTAYGEVVRFDRACFFVTGTVPFTGVALRNGGEAVAFRAMAREDLAPVVLRFAAARLWEAQGWRFPGDLADPVAFGAVLQLAFAGDPTCRFRLPQGSVPDGDAGELELEAVDPPRWRDERVHLSWGPRHLGFRSEREGWF